MSLDETLHATFESLQRAVAQTVAKQVSAASEQMRTAVEVERRVIFEQAEQTARAAADLRAAAAATAASAAEVEKVRQAAYDEGFDAGRADGWDTGRQHGAIEGRHDALAEASARELAASERLVASIREIDATQSVPDALDALLRCVTKEAARAAILLVRATELQGWKFVGFGARTESPTDFRQTVVGAGVIEEAIRTGSAAHTHGAVRVPAPAFAELPLGRRAMGAPIVIQGRTVAVLYADQGQTPHPPDLHAPSEGGAWPGAVEVLTRHVSRCLEAVTALKSMQAAQAKSSTAVSQSASHAAPATSPLPVPMPVAVGGER